MNIDKSIKNLINEKDFFNPFDTFKKSYNKSRDNKVLKKIIDEIKKYDVFDFISRVSALNLIPENQNKSILLDAIIASLLTLKRDKYTSTNKMSSGKFRNLIKQIDNMDLRKGLDPAENVFIENIMFYGNYLIFPGISYLPGYCLQIMIKTLFLSKNNLDEHFLQMVSKQIQLVLAISDRAATGLEYNIHTVKKAEEINNIVVPDRKRLELMKDLVIIDNNFVQLLVGDDSMIEELYTDFGQGDLEATLNVEQQNFFVKPFLKGNNNETIVLNISILSSFVFHKIIWLADKYGNKEQVISAYNMSVWKDCCRSLNVLGHKKIKEKELGIKLLEQNDFKELLLNVCNNGIMIVTFISDDGRDYSKETIFDMYPTNQFNELIEKRISYLHKKLSNQNIKNENIYHMVIINSYGRGIKASFSKKIFYKPIALNPYELKCISINEKNDSVFLPRYIRAKNYLMQGPTNLFNELNNIEIYVHNRYSFYLSDDFNPKKDMLFLAAGDSIEYILKAVKKEKRHLVESYKEGYLTEVVLNDQLRNIYIEPVLEDTRASLLTEFSNVSIWIYSPVIEKFEEVNIYFSIIDTISYWLAECSEIIQSHTFPYKMIELNVILAGEIQDYYYKTEVSNELKNLISFETDRNIVTLIFTPESYSTFSCIDNTMERKLLELVFRILSTISGKGKISQKQLETIFADPLKKKLFALDYGNNPYLKPLIDKRFRKIKPEDENELLDAIGSEVLASGKWSYGIVKDEERTVIARFVVDYLYSLLQTNVSKLSSKHLAELIVNDLEIVMYNLMLAQNRYAYDVACYQEKKNEILNDFNELNKTSRALKFLAEYIAACPPKGTEILGELQYDKLLAICFLIIDWAYKNDLFYYNIFNTPVEILKSDRVGMKQDEFNKLQLINAEVQEGKLYYTSNSDIRENLLREEFPDIEEELNNAFFDEYSFSFDDFYNSIFGLLSYGDEIKSEVKRANKSELVNWLVKNNKSLNLDKVQRVLQYISLSKRDNFLNPEHPFRSEDVYPWRFNRELSFTRRPVIIRENELIWGNRQLFHMLKFKLDLIYEGKLKTRGKKLSKLIGKISNKRGEDFNNQVYNKISTTRDFIVDKNVKKVNNKKLADENGNTLGDVDVLFIIPYRKRIILTEVKDFNFSKSPYEMDYEYQKMFVDKGGKKSFSTKHKRRAIWIKEHLEDIKQHYGLTGNDWSVNAIFIVNDPIISNRFYNAGATIITYEEITKEKLEKL